MFDKMKDMMEMKSQMSKIRKELDDISIECVSAGNLIKIIISGSQEVKKVEIMGDLSEFANQKLENILKDVINDAIKSSQRAAVGKMSKIPFSGFAEA